MKVRYVKQKTTFQIMDRLYYLYNIFNENEAMEFCWTQSNDEYVK